MSEILDILIGDDDYYEKMESVVLPWSQSNLHDDFVVSKDGGRIHVYYAVNPQEKASIVISHGFCEFVGKYYEMIYYFYQMGYSVFFLEYRGHGFSHRMTKDYDRVTIKDYQSYVEDLEALIDQVAKEKSLTQNFMLFAHSMGGCVGALYLEQHPETFKAAVMSAPMLEMYFRGTKDWQVKLLMVISTILGWGEKYVPGQGPFTGVNNYPKCSCKSKPRFDFQFNQRIETKEYQSFGATYNWTKGGIKATKKAVENASLVTIPVKLFQAGEDTMVSPGGQEEFAKKAPNCTLVKYENAKHEIFNDLPPVMQRYFPEVMAFFDEHAND